MSIEQLGVTDDDGSFKTPEEEDRLAVGGGVVDSAMDSTWSSTLSRSLIAKLIVSEIWTA